MAALTKRPIHRKAVSQMVLEQLRDSVDYVEGHWTRNTISYCVRELGIIEKEEAEKLRCVNGLRFLNHFGITVHIISRTVVFDLRQRKDYSVADFHQFLREFYGDSVKWSKDPAEIWADIEAHFDANGIVVHEGLRIEMRKRIAKWRLNQKRADKDPRRRRLGQKIRASVSQMWPKGRGKNKKTAA
jgi:hypothetical protein